MAEYIEREAAVNKLTAMINESGKYTAYESGLDDAAYVIEHEIPAADVVPVRHATWIFSGGDYPYCSGCGCESLSRVKRPYCQFCGALMDGKDGKKS
jgi:hypothetical protein